MTLIEEYKNILQSELINKHAINYEVTKFSKVLDLGNKVMLQYPDMKDKIQSINSSIDYLISKVEDKKKEMSLEVEQSYMVISYGKNAGKFY